MATRVDLAALGESDVAAILVALEMRATLPGMSVRMSVHMSIQTSVHMSIHMCVHMSL